MTLDSPIRELKGIGAKTEELFHKIDIYTIRDLLFYFPRDYEKFPEICSPDETLADKKNAIVAKITKKPSMVPNSRVQLVTTDLCGIHTKVRLSWFRSPYVRNLLETGKTYIFYGMVKQKGRLYLMDQPEIFTQEKYEAVSKTLQPHYPLTAGLTNHMFQKAMRASLDALALELEYLPEDIRNRQHLCEYNFALENIHFPQDEESCIIARNRLVFDEFLFFILSMKAGKNKERQIQTAYHWEDDGYVDDLMRQLPFSLTEAQKHTVKDIQRDLAGGYAMQRLIQGDVGSGKTIVAFLAMLDTVRHGYQAAIMAPTDVLARQHYEKLCDLCKEHNLSYPVVLLTGSLTARQKREAYAVLEEHSDALIVGTHALIQERPQYNHLALVITDEQHRFGVRQRESFAQKGEYPHILVMSATPIPRTLAIILYGDLDISVIDQVPASRLPIKNCVVDTSYRPKAYAFIEKQVQAGRQAYIICPLVEASENMDGENVMDYAKQMSDHFRGICTVGCLHGKMKADEKNKIMEEFLHNKIQILISTTVVEVGVDVPNATVMMIENAERFGLAQLHQLRGRVGRGKDQSYCIMIDGSGNKKKNKRLDILNHTNDGFEIAGQDLKLRGPGDFFGIRQSGDFAFRIADIYQDADLLKAAAYESGLLLQQEDLFDSPFCEKLRHRLERYQKNFNERINL